VYLRRLKIDFSEKPRRLSRSGSTELAEVFALPTTFSWPIVGRASLWRAGSWQRPRPAIIVATTGRTLLTDPLEGVRSVGAVKRCQFTAGNGCEGPQPSKLANVEN